MQGRRGMDRDSPMQSMHMLPSRVFNIRGYPHLLWYAPSTMVLVLLSSKYRAPRYFDVAHTEDHKVPYILVASLTEYHGKWTSSVVTIACAMPMTRPTTPIVIIITIRVIIHMLIDGTACSIFANEENNNNR